MQEKSYHDLVNDYQRRKIEANGKFRHGKWEKCPMCNGEMSIPCDNCKGTGHMMGQPRRVNSENSSLGKRRNLSGVQGATQVKVPQPPVP